ncbi:MAG: T9SS type A sorting domain-containing protein, partial [Omnitrophica WOR_2 bacterium]
GDEKLTVEVYNGTSWATAANITAEGDLDWDLQHIKITNSAKNKVFRVRFVANGVNTLDINNWQIDNIHIYRLCAAPTNLTASVPDPTNHGDQILLEWEAPSTPQGISGWLKWDDGTNAGNGVGLTSGGTFLAAARFTPEQLTAWAGTSLTKIRMFPYAATGCTFVLKVWTGANAGTLVASQPVTFTSDQWNEFSLNTPVYVTGSTELWFGYEVTHAAGQYPGGTDAGPAVAGYGDMISTDGSTWDPMSTFDLNYNWNIEGFVETLDGATQLLQPIVNNTVYNNSSSTLAMSPVTNVNNPNATVATTTTSSSRELTGYNVYREDAFVATTTETSYLDTDPTISILGAEYCYKVTAVYEDCESDFSNTDCETVVDAQNIELGAVNVYPNPSNNVVNIEVTNDISQVVIYNYAGQIVYQQMVTKDKNIQIDVRNYNAGAYLVKFITRSGESFAKKVAVTK